MGFHPGKGRETWHRCWKGQKRWLPGDAELRRSPAFFLLGATYCILRVEDVRGRRVVHDDHFAQLPPEAAQVLHVVPPMENTGLSEEPGPEHSPAVQQVGDRVCILQSRHRMKARCLGEPRADPLQQGQLTFLNRDLNQGGFQGPSYFPRCVCRTPFLSLLTSSPSEILASSSSRNTLHPPALLHCTITALVQASVTSAWGLCKPPASRSSLGLLSSPLSWNKPTLVSSIPPYGCSCVVPATAQLHPESLEPCGLWTQSEQGFPLRGTGSPQMAARASPGTSFLRSWRPSPPIENPPASPIGVLLYCLTEPVATWDCFLLSSLVRARPRLSCAPRAPAPCRVLTPRSLGQGLGRSQFHR